MVRSTAGLSFAGYGEAIIDDNAQGKGVLAAAWRGGEQQRSRQTSGVRDINARECELNPSGALDSIAQTRIGAKLTVTLLEAALPGDIEPKVSAMQQVNDAALLLGRLFLAALFLPSGISKALGFGAFAGSLAAKGLPYSEAWAAAAVAIEVLGPIALILGVVPRWTAVVLIAFVIMATATTHRYWEFTEAAARRAQEINFYKNGGIVAALLFYFVSGAGAWSIAGWRPNQDAQPHPA